MICMLLKTTLVKSLSEIQGWPEGAFGIASGSEDVHLNVVGKGHVVPEPSPPPVPDMPPVAVTPPEPVMPPVSDIPAEPLTAVPPPSPEPVMPPVPVAATPAEPLPPVGPPELPLS